MRAFYHILYGKQNYNANVTCFTWNQNLESYLNAVISEVILLYKRDESTKSVSEDIILPGLSDIALYLPFLLQLTMS